MEDKEIISRLILFSVALLLLFAYTVYCLWRTEQKLKKVKQNELKYKLIFKLMEAKNNGFSANIENLLNEASKIEKYINH